ncbi:MAG: response regulator [Thermodesulfobacteriota bacterium]
MKTTETETTVLIVDDEKDFAATLAERLELRGYRALAANCAEDALALVLSYPPDVVILDIKMPDLSGYEILEEIKESVPTTEVILLTGHGAITNGIDGVVKGAFDFLMKPVTMNTLLEKIQAAKRKKDANNPEQKGTQ